VWQHGFVGFGTRLTLNAGLSGTDVTGDKPGAMLDFLARLGVHVELEQQVWLQLMVTPGYSVIRRPGLPNPHGVTAGFHLGLVGDIGTSGYWNLEAGYQTGAQSFSYFGGGEYAYELSYLQVALGAGVRF
jgi:hypothetical protein